MESSPKAHKKKKLLMIFEEKVKDNWKIGKNIKKSANMYQFCDLLNLFRKDDLVQLVFDF